MSRDFASLGIEVPEIWLPKQGVDLSKWAVVACDQYTAQPEYWQKAAELAGDDPSTLNLIFPEVYLGKGNEQARITGIHQKMKAYLESGVLESAGHCFIYLDRSTRHIKSRKGLIVALDLEKYDYNKGSQTLIRATEGTVLDRIPPRVKIRSGAPLELPHILVLIDDPDCRVIEPLARQVDRFECIYDVELMQGGGHVKGYKISDPAVLDGIAAGLEKLADPGTFNQKYGLKDQAVLLYAMGDGNHSLATAKAIWESVKTELTPDEFKSHPARFALVELSNVHDDGITFEPIHRIVFHADYDRMVAEMQTYYSAQGSSLSIENVADEETMHARLAALREGVRQDHFIGVAHGGKFMIMAVKNLKSNLEVGTLQAFLDVFVRANPGAEVDYIHGADVVTDLGSKPGNIGFYLPPMDKGDLFKTVILDGVLPRKTFSMGEAEDKRFYMECRKIM
jgi:hypothetical protein